MPTRETSRLHAMLSSRHRILRITRAEYPAASAGLPTTTSLAPALAAAPVVSVPAPVGQTVIPDNPAGTTVDEVKSDESGFTIKIQIRFFP